MQIKTSRFVLRDFLEADRLQFVAYQMDPRYRRLYNFNDSETRAHELFDCFGVWRKQNPRQNFQVGVFELGRSQLIGCGGLRQQGMPEGTAVLGLELVPDAWGRYGVAIEIVSALIEHGFLTFGFSKVVGNTASGNSRVERLAQWFGATIVARRDGPEWMKVRGWQEVDWAVSRSAWSASPGRQRMLGQ
jgi:[ribosomal protein S5]-alanine N-acetyltransferase